MTNCETLVVIWNPGWGYSWIQTNKVVCCGFFGSIQLPSGMRVGLYFNNWGDKMPSWTEEIIVKVEKNPGRYLGRRIDTTWWVGDMYGKSMCPKQLSVWWCHVLRWWILEKERKEENQAMTALELGPWEKYSPFATNTTGWSQNMDRVGCGQFKFFSGLV